MKIDEHFSGMLSEAERESLAALIYDPVAEIKRRKKSEKDFDAWCKSAIYRLVIICRSVSSKYTRSKVRRILPDNSGYAMDELLFADDDENRTHYYNEIIDSIVEYRSAETMIVEFARTISSLAVDHLHIIEIGRAHV